MPEHILSTFDQELNRLRQDVLTMASIARKNLASAMRGLLERDTDLCNAAIAADQDVNELEKTIDRLGMQVLLKYQPTAHDLRQVMGTIRVANNIERISDQAGSIAKRARLINNLPEMAELNLIEPVYHLCARNLEASMNAFAEADVEAAAAARLLDKELDAAEKVLDQQLRHLPRYLKAIQVRAERAANHPAKDADKAAQIADFDGWETHVPKSQHETFRWMLEEFRVSIFAQELGTAQPVSAKRLEAMWVA